MVIENFCTSYNGIRTTEGVITKSLRPTEILPYSKSLCGVEDQVFGLERSGRFHTSVELLYTVESEMQHASRKFSGKSMTGCCGEESGACAHSLDSCPTRPLGAFSIFESKQRKESAK